MYLGPELSAGSTLDRLSSLEANDVRRHDLAAFDIKAPLEQHDKQGNFYLMITKPSQQQREQSQVYIIYSARNPNFVALIPSRYLKKKDDYIMLHSFRPPWTIQPITPFAPQLSPFIVPVAQLGQALENLREYNLEITTE